MLYVCSCFYVGGVTLLWFMITEAFSQVFGRLPSTLHMLNTICEQMNYGFPAVL